jgi:hypothetical protein
MLDEGDGVAQAMDDPLLTTSSARMAMNLCKNQNINPLGGCRAAADAGVVALYWRSAPPELYQARSC